MKLKLLCSVLLLLSLVFPVEAREYHGLQHHHHSAGASVGRHHHGQQHHHRIHHSKTVAVGPVTGRPSAWCGWQMRQWFGGGSEYDVAANWAHRGVASNPQIGAYVVWPHHVGVITGYDTGKGQWIVKSGNDGHQIRERPRSIAGAKIRLENGSVGNFKKAMDSPGG